MKTRARASSQRHERGFTLIEIMISLVISSLLVAMILSIFTSMSAAYRSQQQVAELQQVLQAAQASIEADIRQAGFRCAQGFTYGAGGTVLQPPLLITDGGTGQQAPDQIAVFYGDPSAQAKVVMPVLNPLTSMVVDAPDKFVVGDLVLFSVTNPNPFGVTWTGFATQGTGARPPEEPAIFDTNVGTTIVVSYACVLQITAIAGTTITFSTAAPWGSATNSHCSTVALNAPANISMLYRFVARAYRIDPTRKNLSVFQRSPSGGLVANDWQDLGLGFTNFQIASRWYEQYLPPGQSIIHGVDNADSDTDPWRNWYSGTLQNTRSLQSVGYLGTDANQWVSALQVSVSFVARTTRPIVDGTVTGATPQLQDPLNVNFNDVGDSPPVPLAGVADAARPLELRGNNIYRYATIKIDTRNLGVGR